jgi:ABC-type glycerol-3-phosphate transport system substrate-binding protein
MNFVFYLSLAITLLFLHFPSLLKADKNLTLWISSFQDQSYYEQMAELYVKKSGEEINLQVEAFGFREMPDKLGAVMRTGQGAPDLVQLDETFFGVFLNGPSPFVDLTQKLHKSELNKTLHPRRLEVFTFEGKTYGVPQSLSALVLYYRKDLFADFDIQPEDITTWEDFARVGQGLMDNQGQRFLALDGTLFDSLLRQKGTDFFDQNGAFLPDEDVAISILSEFADMAQKQIAVMPDRGSIFDPVFFSGDLEMGEVLCVIGADWYGLDLFQQFAPGMEGMWGMLPLPTWKKADGSLGPRTASFAGQGLIIMNSSEKQDEAWDFIEFVMTDADANAERFLQGNSFPAYLPAWDDPRLLGIQPYFQESMGKLLLELADEIPPVVVNPGRPQAIFLMKENFFSSAMYGSLSPEDTVKQMREAMKAGFGGPPED